jgi:hypothetical protein
MTKKPTTAKLKAHLAMAAFMVMAIATITLTAVGVFGYATLVAGVHTDGAQASAQSASFNVGSLSSSTTTSPEN